MSFPNQSCLIPYIGLHNRENTNKQSSFSHGYRDSQRRFRSIMAYNCNGRSCPRVKMFSTPNIRYQGRPIGDARNDCARQINNVRTTVAKYYPHKSTGGNPPSPSPPSPSPPTGGNTSHVSYTNGAYPDKCLDLSSADTSNSNDLTLWSCNGRTNQKWKLDSNGFLRSQVNQNKCMVPTGNASSGAGIVIWDCSNSFTYMKWSRDSRGRFVLRANSSKCLDVKEDGRSLQIWDCNDRSDKIWNIKGGSPSPSPPSPSPPTGGNTSHVSYTNGAYPDKCLDLSSADTSNSNDLTLWSCNGRTNQKWKLDSNGFLRSQVNQNKCMVPTGNASSGAGIVIWDCSNSFTYMKWSRDSRGRFVLRANSSKCLDVKEDGRSLQIWDCNDRSDKIWNVA